MTKLFDEVQALVSERDAAVLERDTAITDAADRIKDLLDERDNLREALAIFADDENWRLNHRLDPNGSTFDGIEVARAALKATQ